MDDESENHQVQLDQALHHNGVNRSRAGTASSSHQPTVGFGMVNRRSKTPEPWVKRLADDGMSFYYFNPVTGAIQWTAPVATEPIQNQSGNIVSSSDNLVASLVADKEVKRPDIPPSTRVRTESDASALDPFLRRASVYSDDSDVNPFDGPGGKSRSGGAAPSEESSVARSSNPPVLPSGTAPAIEEISPEHAAVQLQSALLPAPTETVDVLSSVAREAISSVVDAVGWQAHHSHRPGSTSSYPADTAARVSSVVISVRNLLYASGTLAAPLSSLAPQTAMEEPVESARSPFAELKPFQRKVTATLSKLVLSARAANSNPDWPIAESSSRVDDDATELERAVVTFVLEAQRLNSWSRTKRLYGVFMSEPGSSGVGPGLFGGGVGGSSKGLGFMPLLSGVQRPQRRLDKALSKDLSQIRSEVDEKLSSLEATIAKRASNGAIFCFYVTITTY
jgi:son of sevenless-like protein